MTTLYEKEIQAAEAAVRAASVVCRSVRSAITPDVLKKKDRSPVTVADFASQAVVCRALGEAFPDDPMIGEEDAHALRSPENEHFLTQIQGELNKIELELSPDEICTAIDRGNAAEFSERFWTLDPIDGTKGFLRGGQYAVSLALIVDGDIKVAVLGCPNYPVVPDQEEPQGVLFTAVRGEGAFMVPLDGASERRPIHTADVAAPADARLCESVEAGHSSHGRSAQISQRLGMTREPYRLDSQAKYAAVARGDADVYLRLPTKPGYVERIWDHAGGVLVVEEAGGKVTDVRGNPLEFTHGAKLSANLGVIVTNTHLHAAVLEAVDAIAS